jgi:hypothetical protein
MDSLDENAVRPGLGGRLSAQSDACTGRPAPTETAVIAAIPEASLVPKPRTRGGSFRSLPSAEPHGCLTRKPSTAYCSASPSPLRRSEHAAIAAMVTAGEYQIARIVAVWRDEQGRLYVLPPCGRCREFIRQIDPVNLDTEVVLGLNQSALLRDLLPVWEWPTPLPVE